MHHVLIQIAGEPDTTDNCPLVANADQTNTDNADDGGDACDADDDNDGKPGEREEGRGWRRLSDSRIFG